jgi:hypothetical protein
MLADVYEPRPFPPVRWKVWLLKGRSCDKMGVHLYLRAI